jgi:hypothetical protein
MYLKGIVMKTLLSLTLAALAGSTTVAFAESYFTLSHVQERDSIVELGTIASDSDGVVQVFSYHGGEKGPMLGWEALHAGANSKVRVPLASTPRTSGVAELVVDGRVVATQAIRFDD